MPRQQAPGAEPGAGEAGRPGLPPNPAGPVRQRPSPVRVQDARRSPLRDSAHPDGPTVTAVGIPRARFGLRRVCARKRTRPRFANRLKIDDFKKWGHKVHIVYNFLLLLRKSAGFFFFSFISPCGDWKVIYVN